MAFPPEMAVLDADDRAPSAQLHRLSAAADASRQAFISQREISPQLGEAFKVLDDTEGTGD
jgi:hypothetical protein